MNSNDNHVRNETPPCKEKCTSRSTHSRHTEKKLHGFCAGVQNNTKQTHLYKITVILFQIMCWLKRKKYTLRMLVNWSESCDFKRTNHTISYAVFSNGDWRRMSIVLSKVTLYCSFFVIQYYFVTLCEALMFICYYCWCLPFANSRPFDEWF